MHGPPGFNRFVIAFDSRVSLADAVGVLLGHIAVLKDSVLVVFLLGYAGRVGFWQVGRRQPFSPRKKTTTHILPDEKS